MGFNLNRRLMKKNRVTHLHSITYISPGKVNFVEDELTLDTTTIESMQYILKKSMAPIKVCLKYVLCGL